MKNVDPHHLQSKKESTLRFYMNDDDDDDDGTWGRSKTWKFNFYLKTQ